MYFKLDNVTNLTAARWAAAEGFDFIGFNFNKNEQDYISPMMAAEICKWVVGPKFIGCFNTLEIQTIRDIYDVLNLDAIEIPLASAEKFDSCNTPPLLLSTHAHNYAKALEFAKYNQNVFAYSTLEDNWNAIDFPMESFFVPALPKPKNLKIKPFGIHFNVSNELEPGIINFDLLNESLEFWKSKMSDAID